MLQMLLPSLIWSRLRRLDYKLVGQEEKAPQVSGDAPAL